MTFSGKRTKILKIFSWSEITTFKNFRKISKRHLNSSRASNYMKLKIEGLNDCSAKKVIIWSGQDLSFIFRYLFKNRRSVETISTEDSGQSPWFTTSLKLWHFLTFQGRISNNKVINSIIKFMNILWC